MSGSFAPRQLALALDHSVSFAREDFLSGPSNIAALNLIEHWPDWPDRLVALIGPEGSGKSHLAAIWAEEAGARILSTNLLSVSTVPAALATGALVVEDLDADDLDEQALFHLINLAREEDAYVFLTGRLGFSGFRSQFAILLLDCALFRRSCSSRRMTRYCGPSWSSLLPIVNWRLMSL